MTLCRMFCWETLDLDIHVDVTLTRIISVRFSICGISPNYGGPTLQIIELKGTGTNILLPDITAHLWRSCGVCASTDESCSGA